MKNSKNVADVLKIHDTVFWGLHYTIFCIRIAFGRIMTQDTDVIPDRDTIYPDKGTIYVDKTRKNEENRDEDH